MARVLIQQGKHERAFMFIEELMRTHTGRSHARRLLAEFYDNSPAPAANAKDPGHAPAPAAGTYRKA